MKTTTDYSLYLITDRENYLEGEFLFRVETAIQAGVTLVQVREKDASTREFYEIALKVKAITDRYQVPLIINDRADIALAVDAAGVHIGDDELPVDKTRQLIGPDKLLGVSADSLARAQEAKDQGADYLGVGAMFPTESKADADHVTLDTLKEITQAGLLPTVAVGGISPETIGQLAGTGIDGVAVISAIMKADNISLRVRQLLDQVKAITG